MKGANVEILAQHLLRFFSELKNFQLTNLVSQRLPRPGNIAVDLINYVELGLGCIVLEKIEPLTFFDLVL